MDTADRAESEQEAIEAGGRAFRYPELVACRRCHYCDEDVREGLKFCDKTCRDWWEDEQKAKKRNGKALR